MTQQDSICAGTFARCHRNQRAESNLGTIDISLYSLPDSEPLPSVWDSAKLRLHSAKALPSVTLAKEHSAAISSAKTSLPSAFCRALGKGFAECQKALGKEKHSAKCKLEKSKKIGKKLLGRHAQPASDPSNRLHIFFSNFPLGCTFFQQFFYKLSMIGFKLTTSCTQITLSISAPLDQVCQHYVFILHIL
jgi:hypothetical protein